MTKFKARLEILANAGHGRLIVKEGARPPLLALDADTPWRERVEGFFRKVLGAAPDSVRLADMRVFDSPEPELRIVVECVLRKASRPRDERLAWEGEDPSDGAPGGANPDAVLDPAETALLYTDGGSRGNPGPAGIGALLFQRGSGYEEELYSHIGTATNNVAEYTALVEGLLLAHERGARRVEHFTDSELMVRQLEGTYKVKSAELKLLVEQVRGLVRRFDSFRTSHVRRELNKRADSLVNRALDEALKNGETQAGRT